MATDAPLPNPSRHITANSAEGTAHFSNEHATALAPFHDMNGAIFRLAYDVPAAPTLDGSDDLKGYSAALDQDFDLVPSVGGTRIWYVDTPPGGGSPLHRTVSLDFCVLLQGELELELEAGEKRVVKAGDVVVQRGTLHKWKNVGQGWARMVGMMIAVDKIVTEQGKELETSFAA